MSYADHCLLLQTYCGSDIDVFSFGNPINTAALFIVLFHLLIECKSVVSTFFQKYIPSYITIYIKNLYYLSVNLRRRKSFIYKTEQV